MLEAARLAERLPGEHIALGSSAWHKPSGVGHSSSSEVEAEGLEVPCHPLLRKDIPSK